MIPKIAFLFLTVGHIYHEQLWQNFFAQHEKQYSIYIHTKKPLPKHSVFKKYELHKSVPTTWANTMRAQIVLLQEALKDPANEKFVYISESTIPLQPFDAVYETLMRHPYSQFHYYKNPHPSRSFGPLKHDKIYKNAQWVVLNRKHAQMMAEDTELIKIFTQGPHDQEHYPSTFLAQRQMLREVVKKDTTLAVWNGVDASPHLFTDLNTDKHTTQLMKVIKNKRFLFARKFHKDCNVKVFCAIQQAESSVPI